MAFSLIEKQVLQGVDYGIMGNRASVEVWQRKGYQGQHQVIPQFGVDAQKYQPARRLDSGRVFTIGSANRRLVAEKGVDLLLRAAVELPGVWRLLIAGEGPERPLLEQLAAQLGIRERVQFDGSISSTEMPAYLSQIDALVLSSRTLPNWMEQFGRILVEAMACGVPVVGSESGEIPNVIGDAGLTFPEDDVAALCERLQQLMQSETLRKTLAKRGREHVLKQYTQAQIAAQTVSVYREVMANG